MGERASRGDRTVDGRRRPSGDLGMLDPPETHVTRDWGRGSVDRGQAEGGHCWVVRAEAAALGLSSSRCPAAAVHSVRSLSM